MFAADDTIVAIATPPGRGGIGVVRLSGQDAVRIGQALIARQEPFEPRHATFARILDDTADGAGRPLDQVVVTWFAAPHSFTGDDVVEVSGHGSPVLLSRIVELAMAAGARLAEPGEFTLRAYLNGRIDLVQAEAVADLVDAVTPLQARAAMDQLEGTLTSAIGRIDAALFDLSAKLEASLDFPDEGFHFVLRDEAARDVARVRASLDDLAREGRVGRVVREGRIVVIAGRPNSGKSSLFNALVGAARAIVTDLPGTTRDVLTERIDLGGIPLTLVDTAGLREAADAIEAEGVARAREAQRVATLTLVLVDGSRPATDDDRAVIASAGTPRLVVRSKADLARAWSDAELDAGDAMIVGASVVAPGGLEALRREMIRRLVDMEDWRDVPAISNLRHLALVDAARESLAHAETALADGATEELVLTDLTAARRALEEVTGARSAEDLLRHIFQRFCIGK
jgi:tRNA modification GTPase